MSRINRSRNEATTRRELVRRTQDMQRQNEENLQAQSRLESDSGILEKEKANSSEKSFAEKMAIMRAAEANEEQITQFIEKRNGEEKSKINENRKKEISTKAENEPNPETATERLKSVENVTEFGMVDINGKSINYGNKEWLSGHFGQIKLPEGTLVSRLKPNPNNPEYIHVIAWHNKKYRDGYIHETSFSGTYQGGSKYDAKVFIDDAWHTVHRAELLMKRRAQVAIWSKQDPNNDKDVQHLKEILELVKADLLLVQKGKIKITPDLLKQIKEADERSLKIDLMDKPGTMQRITKSIFNTVDPKLSNGQKLSETALFVPLTDTWFEDDMKLKKHYQTVISDNENLSRIRNNTGEGTEDVNAIKEWFFEFKFLREIIKGSMKEKSPEGIWLQAITPETEQRTKRMIFVGGEAWKLLAERKSKYSSLASVQTSFGPIQTNQLKLLLMHELNVNTNSSGVSLFGKDSHAPFSNTKEAWDKVNKEGFSSISSDEEQLEGLFQTQNGRTLVLLFGYLNKIKALNADKKN